MATRRNPRVTVKRKRTSGKQGPRAPMSLVERMQVRAVLIVNVYIDQLMRALGPLLAERYGAQRQDAARADATLEEIFRRVTEGRFTSTFLETIFRSVDAQAAADLRLVPSIDTPSVLPNTRELEQQWVKRNTDLIRLEERARDEVAGILRERTPGTVRVEQVRDEIQDRLRVTRSRAELIARDQTLKLYGQIQQERQTDAGIVEYVWSTSDDERVRQDHADLDGTTQRWDSPPIVDKRTGRREHPGGDYQCRCAALPVLETATAADEPAPPPTPERVRLTPEPIPDLQFAAPPAPVQIARALVEAPASQLLEQAEALDVGRRMPRVQARAEALQAIEQAVAGKTLADLRAIPFTPEDLAADTSLAFLRRDVVFGTTGNVADNFGRSKGGLPQITIEADGKVYLSNGRHRLTVARELRLRQIQARVRKIGPRGAELWDYVGQVRI